LPNSIPGCVNEFIAAIRERRGFPARTLLQTDFCHALNPGILLAEVTYRSNNLPLVVWIFLRRDTSIVISHTQWLIGIAGNNDQVVWTKAILASKYAREFAGQPGPKKSRGKHIQSRSGTSGF
jgi:hypothetical protein